MYGKDNIAMQRVFQVHILQAQKSEKNFWKSAAEWNATGFPHWQGFSHRRSSPPVGWTRMSTLPLPGPSVLNECAQKQLDLSAERVAGVNTNSHAEVVSAGLQWAYEAPMEVHSLHCALYETHNCLRLSHTTFKRAWFTTFQHKVGHRSRVGQRSNAELDNLVLTAPTRDKIPTCPKHPPACPLETLKSDFWGRKSNLSFCLEEILFCRVKERHTTNGKWQFETSIWAKI